MGCGESVRCRDGGWLGGWMGGGGVLMKVSMIKLTARGRGNTRFICIFCVC